MLTHACTCNTDTHMFNMDTHRHPKLIHTYTQCWNTYTVMDTRMYTLSSATRIHSAC